MHFASDNYAGVDQAIIEAMSQASRGHVPSYGNDDYTKKAEEAFRKIFGDVEVFFVFNGTAANVLSLKPCLKSFEGVICSERAHIHEDESGAPEFILGSKLITLPTSDGKITPDQLEKVRRTDGDQHRVQTRVVSVTQCTEYGTVYQLDELKAIRQWCKEHNHLLHVDGARLANAAVSLGVGLKEACGDCDVLSFGATKNGIMFGEAVVFFNKGLSQHFKNYRKQSMQLMSKMRFLSVQLETYLTKDIWRKNAQSSNRMAKLLEQKLKGLPVTINQKVEANSLFVELPKAAIPKIQKDYQFYVWTEKTGMTSEARWMTSFDTTESEIEAFYQSVKNSLV